MHHHARLSIFFANCIKLLPVSLSGAPCRGQCPAMASLGTLGSTLLRPRSEAISLLPALHREPEGHGLRPALPLHVHHPAVQPVLHASDHPLPPPPWPGLAEGVRAVCVLRWLRPGHWTGECGGHRTCDACLRTCRLSAHPSGLVGSILHSSALGPAWASVSQQL